MKTEMIVTQNNGSAPSVRSEIQTEVLERLMLNGDLSQLTPQQKIEWYRMRCESVGLDPASKPFDYLKLSGKEVLYATKTCTEQLSRVHKLTQTITSKEIIGELYIVTARVTSPDGRSTENVGAVPAITRGDDGANAIMKAITKAYRRTILSHCGLGMLDETEIETIPNAAAIPADIAHQQQPAPVPAPKVLSKYLQQMADNARAAGYPVDEENLPREWYQQENEARAALLKKYSELSRQCEEIGLKKPRAADPNICVLALEGRIERIQEAIDDKRAAILEAEADTTHREEPEILEGEEVVEAEEFPVVETPKTPPDAFKFSIPDETPKSVCRSCKADIFWIKTRNGKNMPVNPDGTSHFSSCPNAEGHRRERDPESHIKALFATANDAQLDCNARDAMIAAINAHLRDTRGFKPIASRKQLSKFQADVLISSIESGHLKW